MFTQFGIFNPVYIFPPFVAVATVPFNDIIELPDLEAVKKKIVGSDNYTALGFLSNSGARIVYTHREFDLPSQYSGGTMSSFGASSFFMGNTLAVHFSINLFEVGAGHTIATSFVSTKDVVSGASGFSARTSVIGNYHWSVGKRIEMRDRYIPLLAIISPLYFASEDDIVSDYFIVVNPIVTNASTHRIGVGPTYMDMELISKGIGLITTGTDKVSDYVEAAGAQNIKNMIEGDEISQYELDFNMTQSAAIYGGLTYKVTQSDFSQRVYDTNVSKFYTNILAIMGRGIIGKDTASGKGVFNLVASY